jgi:ABC-2 type transport system permease protein
MNGGTPRGRAAALEARPEPAGALGPAARAGGSGQAGRFGPAVRAEWTKLRTVAGPAWLLLTAAALTVGLSALTAGVVHCPATGCGIDATKTGLTGFQLGQAVIAVLAVLVVGGEYSTGMMHTTLTAIPNRATMLAAKAAVLTAPVLAVGAVGALGSVLFGRLLLPGNGFTPEHGYRSLSLVDSMTLRAAGGSVLYLGLIAMLSLGVAVLIRDTAVAIGAVLGLLYLFPIVATMVTSTSWKRHLQQISPTNAGLAIQNTLDLHNPPLGPWAGLGVLTLWAAGALLVGWLVLRLRDA